MKYESTEVQTLGAKRPPGPAMPTLRIDMTCITHVRDIE